MTERHQVIIVGGGPVGTALALDLGLRGISCVLLERRMELSRIPKGQNLTQRTLEHFYFWGIGEELRAARVMPANYPIGEVTAYGSLSSDYWHAPAGREVVRPYYFQDNERLPQYEMEKVLRRKLADLSNVEACFGWAATAFEQSESGVRVTIREQSGGHERMVEGNYLVACDGAHSTIRDQSGIERSGSDFNQRMVLAVFRSRQLTNGLKRLPNRSTYRVMHPDYEGYWQFFGRIDVEEGWFFHAPVSHDYKPDNAGVLALIQKAAGFKFGCEFDYVGFWDLRVSVADRYRAGHVFIAGDAAHSHPPYGGFGLNNGLEDIVNLGWKLAAVLKGWGGGRLLDSYGEERQPVFHEVAEDLIASRIAKDAKFLATFHPDRNREEFEQAWNDRKSEAGNRARQYEPNYAGSPIVAGSPGGVTSAHGQHSFLARPGHHLAPQSLSSGRNVFEEIGREFSLLAFDADSEPFEFATAQLGVPLKIVRDSSEETRAAYGAKMILIRPDQFVVWTGDCAPVDTKGLIKMAVGLD